jgi:hypothetical protein
MVIIKGTGRLECDRDNGWYMYTCTCGWEFEESMVNFCPGCGEHVTWETPAVVEVEPLVRKESIFGSKLGLEIDEQFEYVLRLQE